MATFEIMKAKLVLILLSVFLVQCSKKVDFKELEAEEINWCETTPSDSTLSATMIDYYPVYKTSTENDKEIYCSASIVVEKTNYDTLIILSLSREDDFTSDVLEGESGILNTKIDRLGAYRNLRDKKIMVNAKFTSPKYKTYFGDITLFID